MTAPFSDATLSGAQDALSEITHMMVGTKILQDQPGVVYSLAQQQAHPADAQAIDQFMQALDSEKQVRLAEATGQQLNLSDHQKTLLGQIGVDYSGVEYKAPVPTTQPKAPEQKHDGWFSSVGSFFSHVGNAITGGLSAIGHATVDYGIKPGLEELTALGNLANHGLRGELANQIPGHQIMDVQDNITRADATQAQDMTAYGYSPNSVWSHLAFAASGKGHSDLSSLNDEYGPDKVDAGLAFLAHGGADGVIQQVHADPNSFYQDAQGQTHLTPEAQAKITNLQSDDFKTMVQKINAKQNTVGNGVASAIGIDPVSHPTWYKVAAAGTDFAVSFAIDPTLIALKAAKAAKLAQIGIDSLTDSTGAAAVLTRDGAAAAKVQNGWNRGIDLGSQIAAASDAGDARQVAVLTTKFKTELPGLSGIMDQFIGKHALMDWRNPTAAEKAAGELGLKPVFGDTGGIRSLDDASNFIASNFGMSRLMAGRAATQSTMMPGSLSNWGYFKLKSAVAGWMTGRSFDKTANAVGNALDRIEANPALAKPLIDEGFLRRATPEADDAVAHDGTVIQAPAETDGSVMPSQQRAYEFTAAGKGQIEYNLKTTGDPLAERGAIGWASPAAIAARSRLAATRLGALLPRNTVLDIEDPQTGDKLFKMARLYLGRGEASALRGAYEMGDGGQRKAILDGLWDQMNHAAGLGKTKSGQSLMARYRTENEAYSNSGSEIILDGQPIALAPGMTRTTWTFPSFRDWRKAADKIGLWDWTMGRGLESGPADGLMQQWKILTLAAPRTIYRNMIEGWGRTALDGKAGDAIRMKSLSTTRNKDLWDAGYGVQDRERYIAARGEVDGLKSMLKSGGLSREQRADGQARIADAQSRMDRLEAKPIVQHLHATESGDMAKAKEIEKGSLTAGAMLGRNVTMTKLADVLGPVGKAYHLLHGRFMNEDEVHAVANLGADDLQRSAEGFGQQSMESELGFANAAKHASDISRVGYGPARLRYAVTRAKDHSDAQVEHEGIAVDANGSPVGSKWTHHALDGTVGVQRYANALGRLVNKSPGTAKATLEYIDNPDLGLQHIVDALEKEKGNTAFGNVYFEDPYGAPNVARRAVNDDERALGKRDWAQKLVNEYTYLLHSQEREDGSSRFLNEISDHIQEHGKAPSADWISDTIKAADRPSSALAPEVMPMPAGGSTGFWQALQDVEGAGFQWMVERQLQRTTSVPVFLANFAKARVGLNADVEKAVENGLSREAAEHTANELSIKNAWVAAENMIDDPGQKTQFDVIARNLFPFSRAMQAMLRRWGTGLWRNPAAARKMMLAYEGAQHSGFIYNNAYGEPTFTYPGSGVLNETMRAISLIPGFENIAAFPVSPSMTGGVLMSVPGADNPFRMSMGPMISVPLRLAYENLLPTSAQGSMLKLDEMINGPVGAGETFKQFVPSIIRHAWDNLSASDQGSALVSSMNGGFANMAAAGLIPPPNASPSVIRQFRARLQDQVRSQLAVRFAFGLFSPAAPSRPGEQTSASGADFAWSLDGVKALSDEYKSILNDVKGDVAQANVVFTALHPDDVVYGQGGHTILPSAMEVTGTKSVTKGAYLPSTEGALNWLTTNQEFVKKYGTIAAYFLPTPTSNEPFNDAAFKAQLEFGLRQYKMPDEFMSDVYLKHAENTYYPVKAKFDQLIATAKAQGDRVSESQYMQEKSDWEKQYKSLNFDLGAKLADYAPARQTALGQLADLRTALQAGAIPDGLGEKAQQLVQVWDDYNKFVGSIPGSTVTARDAKSRALAMFDDWAKQNLAGTPLSDLYNGVFRVLNTNITKLPTTTGG